LIGLDVDFFGRTGTKNSGQSPWLESAAFPARFEAGRGGEIDQVDELAVSFGSALWKLSRARASTAAGVVKDISIPERPE